MTKAKIVNGFIADYSGDKPYMYETELTLRVTHDRLGKSISITDEHKGIMFEIPVDHVEDLIEVKV